MRCFVAVGVMLSCACLFGGAVQALTVQTGLVPYQVIQCDDAGKASIALTGASSGAGTVQARVVGVQKEALGWADLGKAEGGKWQGTVADVPVGGPYRVELRVRDDAAKTIEEASVAEVLVGDVWILAGQSNMQGCGNRVNVETPSPQVHTFAMGYEWRLAQEPLHTMAESPDPVHASFPNEEERQKAIVGWRDGFKGTGLGLPFAKEMVARTGRPVGLIASAHGGTSMAQWSPGMKDQAGASLYGSMCKQVAAAGGKVRGVLWYQGESDANVAAQAVYVEKMKELVAAMRADLGAPNLPFYYVQISRWAGKQVEWFPCWNKIQADQLALESALAPGGMVAAIDLAIDDGIHIGTSGLKTLGRRLANLAEHDLFAGKVARGPRFEKAEGAEQGFGQIRVKFTSVNGGLKAAGRVSGFSITAGPDGPEAPTIFKQEIADDDPSVVVLSVENVPENGHLWYGHGFDPYCNIVDDAGMAVPAMGPVPLKRQ